MSRRSPVLALLAATVLAAPLLAGCGGAGEPDSSSSSPPEELAEATLKVGVAPTANGLAAQLAAAEGFAEEQNLTLEFTPVNSGAEAIPLLLNGGLDIALGDGIGTITASSNGVPISVFGVNSEAPEDADLDATALVAADKELTMKTLDGKTLAVSQLGGAAELAAKAAIDAAGGDSSAVKYIELDSAQAVPALQNGTIDVALVTEPYATTAEQEGLNMLDRPAASGTPGMPATLWVTSLQFGTEHPDLLTRFIAAIQPANDELNSDPESAREFAKTVIEAPEAVLDVIRYPYFSPDAGDTSGIRDYVELANEYDVFDKKPDLDKLLSIQVGD